MTSDWTSKPANQWHGDDLLRLADNALEEGTYLEFKKVDELMKGGNLDFDLLARELAETASAFLNSDGGVLLIGVQTDRGSSSPTAETLRPLANWEFNKSFEYHGVHPTAGAIRDRILGNIMPKPLGVDVKAIELTIESETSRVLVATIPASYLGAHQSTRTFRYYRRTADGDVPMLDYEIRDVNNRRAGPLLQVMVRMSPEGGAAVRDISEDQLVTTISANQIAGGEGAEYSGRVDLTLMNRGRGTATVARYEIGAPQPWRSGISGGSWDRDDRIKESVGATVSVFMTSPAFSRLSTARQFHMRGIRVDTQAVEWRSGVYRAEDTQPLWPSETLEGNAAQVPVTMPSSTEETYWIPWRVFAEGMVEVRGVVLVDQTPAHIRARNFLLGETDWAGSLEVERHAQLREQFGI